MITFNCRNTLFLKFMKDNDLILAKVSLNMMQFDEFDLKEALENEMFVTSKITKSRCKIGKIFINIGKIGR